MITRRRMLQLTASGFAAWLLGGCKPQPVKPPMPLIPETASGIPDVTLTPTVTATPVPATPVPPCPTEVSVPDTATHVFQTALVHREYKLFVSVPPSYDATDRTYPVLYVLDANAYFVMITEIARWLAYQQVIPEIIIVGLGYNVPITTDWSDLRVRDYTPTFRNQAEEIPGGYSTPTSGGGGTFLKLIREEIKPFIEATYRADPLDAAIHGHSFGGLFALYALFSEPDTFQRYIISSPSIWWDDKVILHDEQAYAETHDDLPARIHMAIGELEGLTVADMEDLARILADRQYPNLRLSTSIFEDEDHSTVIPMEINRGLRMVFPREE